MQTNQKRTSVPVAPTHQGGKAARQDSYTLLRRTILNCLLWEDSFYESGQSIADRIKALVAKCTPEQVFNLAFEARNDFGLRHAPLLLAREMARGTPEQRKLVPAMLPAIMMRPDEIAEFTSIYWASNDGKKFISHPIRRGIALAVNKFSAWKLAKHDKKDRAVRIRDAMFMAHVRPNDLPSNAPKWAKAERKADFKAGGNRAWPFTERETVHFQLANELLKQTGTWEDRMSAGEAAKDVFEDLMANDKLGGLAFIRNVRKMESAGISKVVIREYAKKANVEGIFPHQLITAARHNKQYESMFDEMLLRATTKLDKLPGKTVVLVDVSGSMDEALSKNDAEIKRRAHMATRGKETVEYTTRMDAAAALAVIARELCENVRIFSFSYNLKEIPDRRGMSLVDAIKDSQPHGGTATAAAIDTCTKMVPYDRIIVITDEQAADGSGKPHKGSKAYICNVAPYEHSIATKGVWECVSGWSPHVFRFISQIEGEGEGEAVLTETADA